MKNTTSIIRHTCGHTTTVEIDESVKSWPAHYAQQVCFECEPATEVTRLCGHVDQVARSFQSPRRMESAAMQMCSRCQR